MDVAWVLFTIIIGVPLGWASIAAALWLADWLGELGALAVIFVVIAAGVAGLAVLG